jgi:hypothetical protein
VKQLTSALMLESLLRGAWKVRDRQENRSESAIWGVAAERSRGIFPRRAIFNTTRFIVSEKKIVASS